MWFKIPYKFSLQSMHKQKKYLGKTFFWGWTSYTNSMYVDGIVIVLIVE